MKEKSSVWDCNEVWRSGLTDSVLTTQVASCSFPNLGRMKGLESEALENSYNMSPDRGPTDSINYFNKNWENSSKNIFSSIDVGNISPRFLEFSDRLILF